MDEQPPGTAVGSPETGPGARDHAGNDRSVEGTAPPAVPVAPLAAARVAVVIPCYRVAAHILDVIARIERGLCGRIYVVDDACPEGSGDLVRRCCDDARVVVIAHDANQGVGGAVTSGYRRALADGATIVVKIDGDGQHPPEIMSAFLAPILSGQADYTKGNRFYDLGRISRMPPLRLFGNAVLSFVAKLSAGYWNLFDPTNGYTAIHARVLECLPLDRISRRYFFETDMLFRLNTVRAVVVDVPMDAVYGDEASNLRVGHVVPEFLGKHARNTGKRIFYNYFLRDLSIASFQLVFGALALAFGLVYGGWHWAASGAAGVATPVGTIVLSAVCVLVGLQLLLAFLAYDIETVPRNPIHGALEARRRVLSDVRDEAATPGG